VRCARPPRSRVLAGRDRIDEFRAVRLRNGRIRPIPSRRSAPAGGVRTGTNDDPIGGDAPGRRGWRVGAAPAPRSVEAIEAHMPTSKRWRSIVHTSTKRWTSMFADASGMALSSCTPLRSAARSEQRHATRMARRTRTNEVAWSR
jgi:hypothetical protein